MESEEFFEVLRSGSEVGIQTIVGLHTLNGISKSQLYMFQTRVMFGHMFNGDSRDLLGHTYYADNEFGRGALYRGPNSFIETIQIATDKY